MLGVFLFSSKAKELLVQEGMRLIPLFEIDGKPIASLRPHFISNSHSELASIFIINRNGEVQVAEIKKMPPISVKPAHLFSNHRDTSTAISSVLSEYLSEGLFVINKSSNSKEITVVMTAHVPLSSSYGSIGGTAAEKGIIEVEQPLAITSKLSYKQAAYHPHQSGGGSAVIPSSNREAYLVSVVPGETVLSFKRSSWTVMGPEKIEVPDNSIPCMPLSNGALFLNRKIGFVAVHKTAHKDESIAVPIKAAATEENELSQAISCEPAPLQGWFTLITRGTIAVYDATGPIVVPAHKLSFYYADERPKAVCGWGWCSYSFGGDATVVIMMNTLMERKSSKRLMGSLAFDFSEMKEKGELGANLNLFAVIPTDVESKQLVAVFEDTKRNRTSFYQIILK